MDHLPRVDAMRTGRTPCLLLVYALRYSSLAELRGGSVTFERTRTRPAAVLLKLWCRVHFLLTIISYRIA